MLGAIGVIRHTNDQRIGLPIFNLLGDFDKAGIALSGNRALRLGGAHQAVAHGKTGALDAEVQRQKGLQMGRHHQAAHACPTSDESIHDSKPSKATACS